MFIVLKLLLIVLNVFIFVLKGCCLLCLLLLFLWWNVAACGCGFHHGDGKLSVPASRYEDGDGHGGNIMGTVMREQYRAGYSPLSTWASPNFWSGCLSFSSTWSTRRLQRSPPKKVATPILKKIDDSTATPICKSHYSRSIQLIGLKE